MVYLLLLQYEHILYILGEFHYTWISSLDRLLNQQGVHQRTFCPRCLYGFIVQKNGEENKRKHLEYCSENEAVKIGYPPEGIYSNNNNQNNRNLMV